MPYLNLDDGFADHPKVDALSDGAFRLHVAALCFCAKNTTDGVIPAHRVTRLTRTYKASQLAELLRCAMWRMHPEGYEVHDYLDWNKSAAWWAEKRAKDAARMAEYRAKKEAEKASENSPSLSLLEGGVTT